MSTSISLLKSTAPRPVIYFKIDLTGMISLEGQWAFNFANLVSSKLNSAMTDNGIASIQPPCASHDFVAEHAKAIVVCQKSQTIGLYEVTDWRAGLAIVRAELEALKLFKFSKVGWHDDSENLVRIIWPQPSGELLQPIIDQMRKWLDEADQAIDSAHD